MITENNMYQTIQCDKCGKRSTNLEPECNDTWFKEGWTVSQNGKKYVHLCFECLSNKQKKGQSIR